MSYSFVNFLATSSFPKMLATFSETFLLLLWLPRALLLNRGLVPLLTLALRAYPTFHQSRHVPSDLLLRMVSGCYWQASGSAPPTFKDIEKDENYIFLILCYGHAEGEVVLITPRSI